MISNSFLRTASLLVSRWVFVLVQLELGPCGAPNIAGTQRRLGKRLVGRLGEREDAPADERHLRRTVEDADDLAVLHGRFAPVGDRLADALVALVSQRLFQIVPLSVQVGFLDSAQRRPLVLEDGDYGFLPHVPVLERTVIVRRVDPDVESHHPELLFGQTSLSGVQSLQIGEFGLRIVGAPRPSGHGRKQE